MMNMDGDMIFKILFFILMSHVTINHDALDLTIQGPAPPEGTPCPHTCSNLFIKKHVRLASGRLPSYFSCFLVTMYLNYPKFTY